MSADAALAQHGSIRKAAAALGIPASTFQNRLAAERGRAARGETGGPPVPPIAKPAPGFVVRRNSGEYDAAGNLRRQWIESGQGNTDGWEVPAGHVVKGESALLDPGGNVLAKWVKTREAGAGAHLIEALQEAFAGFRGAAGAAQAPVEAEGDLLTVYPLPDLHFGMLAWGRETGMRFDARIAEDTALRRVGSLVAQSRPSTHAVLLGLGDYFHANGGKPVTPQSGHQLDVDGRWPKVFAAGARLATALVDLLCRKHASVEVVMLPGNHDQDAAVSLTVALALFYANNPRIEVHQEPGIAWYRRFGTCLLGATHGHTVRPAQMAMMLATDRAEDWGQAKHRAFFFGHVHHESVLEVGPVRVESFGSPAARDAWNAAAGYRSGRALTAITFHREDGEIGRHRVSC